MKFKMLFSTALFAFAFQSYASATTTLSVAYGASVPNDPTGQTYVQTPGPSRTGGGEHFVLQLSSGKNVTSIKLSGFSTSRNGKSLVRSVTAISGATKISLPNLSQFSKITAGNPQNYNGLVMLVDGSYVEATPNQVLSQIDFTVEGFSNNDSSLLIQITFADGLAEEEFIFSRSGANREKFGGLINEDDYAKFSASILSTLMKKGAAAQVEDVVNKTFVCSSFTKLDSPSINVKTRAYAMNATGTLQSTSERESSPRVWTATGAGLATTIVNQNGCGVFSTYNVIRKTPAGNLIAEVNLDSEAYVNLCVNAGYDADGVRAVQSNSTFPSVVRPDFVANSYEYCRVQN